MPALQLADLAGHMADLDVKEPHVPAATGPAAKRQRPIAESIEPSSSNRSGARREISIADAISDDDRQLPSSSDRSGAMRQASIAASNGNDGNLQMPVSAD